jgi:hypothetical protein
MNDLQSLANIGEIVGAVAVVVSLVYLAVQVRQNTKAQQSENFSRALDRIAAMQATLSQDSESAVVFSNGVSDTATLSPRERLQFTWAMYELFGAFEFLYLSSLQNAIPEEIWERWSSAIAWWLMFPGVQSWWQARPIPFAESFTAYVDRLIRKNPTDEEAVERFRGFIAGASPAE